VRAHFPKSFANSSIRTRRRTQGSLLKESGLAASDPLPPRENPPAASRVPASLPASLLASLPASLPSRERLAAFASSGDQGRAVERYDRAHQEEQDRVGLTVGWEFVGHDHRRLRGEPHQPLVTHDLDVRDRYAEVSVA